VQQSWRGSWLSPIETIPHRPKPPWQPTNKNKDAKSFLSRTDDFPRFHHLKPPRARLPQVDMWTLSPPSVSAGNPRIVTPLLCSEKGFSTVGGSSAGVIGAPGIFSSSAARIAPFTVASYWRWSLILGVLQSRNVLGFLGNSPD
jgi:hypothetical protein